MKPFLHLSIRDHDEAAEGEYEALCALTGLEPGQLVQLRAEQASLPVIHVDDYAGIIIGGGQFNASDEVKSVLQQRVEAELGHIVDEALVHEVPLIGLCYGVGLVTQRLGGVVDKVYGEKVGAIEVTLTDAAASDPVFAGLPARFRAFTGHKEACAVLPEGAVLLATGEACPVQAFRVGTRAYATQFHPELDVERLVQRMRIYAHHGYFHPDELDDLIAAARAAGVGAEPALILRQFVTEFGR
ncbi:MAG: glutamine amidotransferase [Propionibacteriaceae bacterium]|nr:glutamine amidotransferase [Propionibacteriaceae bacterium]